jgi:hypothetical protein
MDIIKKQKLEIHDDILAPGDTLTIKFKGKNPFTAMKIVPGLIKYGMKISSKDMYEHEVRWDITADPRDFYGKWMGKRADDNWTKSFIRAIVQGVQDSKTKEGNVTVQLKGWILTTYNYANFIQRWFWWIYNRSFYYKQRRMYIDGNKDTMIDIKTSIQKALGIAPEGTI